MRPGRLLLVAGVALAVFVADRITKMWVVENIPVGTARPIAGDYIRIVHAQNTGAAFGLLPERTTLLYGGVAQLPPIVVEANFPTLIVAGLLVGLGTRYGAGCTSGHGVCGLSRLSPRWAA